MRERASIEKLQSQNHSWPERTQRPVSHLPTNILNSRIFLSKYSVETVKHSSGGVLVWACFAASASEQFAVIDETWILFKSKRSWRRLSGHQLKPKAPALYNVMQQDNDLKRVTFVVGGHNQLLCLGCECFFGLFLVSLDAFNFHQKQKKSKRKNSFEFNKWKSIFHIRKVILSI